MTSQKQRLLSPQLLAFMGTMMLCSHLWTFTRVPTLAKLKSHSAISLG